MKTPICVLTGLVHCLVFVSTLRAGEEDLVDLTSPEGTWRISVPRDWRAGRLEQHPVFIDAVGFQDPSVESFTLHVWRTPDLPPDLALNGFKKGFVDSGATDVEEAKFEIDGRAAFRIEGVRSVDGGKRRCGQVFVDGGASHVLLSFEAVEPFPDGLHDRIDRVVSSIKLNAVEPAAPESERQEFKEYGLSIELPKKGWKSEKWPGRLQLHIPRLGAEVVVQWRRSRATPRESLKFEFPTLAGESQGLRIKTLSEEEIEVVGEKALRVRLRATRDERPVSTFSLLYRRNGPEEIVSITVMKLGDARGESLESLEKIAAEARTAPLFSSPAASLAPLSAGVEAWGGQGRLCVPEGWRTFEPWARKPGAGAPTITSGAGWCSERASDLGTVARSGRIQGGGEGYASWLRKSRGDPAERERPLVAREVQVGGRKGLAWDLEEGGPPSDPWIQTVVGVFEGEEYRTLTCRYPARLRGVYGPLAEAVAATVEWKK